jgi:hypothetical protein
MFNFRHLCTQTLPRLSVVLRAFFFLLAASCPTRAQSASAPRAFITEFAAANSTFLDEDGDPSDWLELHNPAASPLVLTGWFLSDDPAQPRKWRFPETVLPAGDFLVIWASGKDRRTAGSPLHTNFSLSGTGESLILSRQDGSVSHQFLNYPALGTMVSYGMQFESARWTPDPLRGVYRVPLGPTPRWFESDFPAGGWSSFTGHQGFGPAAVQPGMRLRQVGAAPGFGEVNTLARCDALLALPGDSPLISVQATERVSSVNYGGSHYPGDTLLPTPATDFYAVQATGMVLIPTAGTYSFGLNSDDGGRIRIDGQDVMVDDSLHGEQDHIGTVTLSAGYHAFDMVMFENGGGDLVEFYAAPGVHTEWSAAMKLVGDTANGGLATFLASPSNGLTEAEMRGIQASCYFRVGLQPTSPPALQALSTLRLHVRYDDGFAAFMNGTRVASRNAPASLTHASTATAMHPLMASDPFESHNLTPFLPLVRFSGNVLALQGLNVSAGDASFFLDAEVVAGRLLVDAPPVAFENGQRTPGTVNSPQTAVLGSAPVLLSVPAGYYTQPFTLTLQSPTPGSTIRYTLDGSTPTATSGAVYSRPLTVAKTSVLRSAAFRAGSAASAVTTATYFFMDDVLTQSPTGAKPSPAWPAVNNGQHFIHYGMSPLIVNSTDPEIGGRAKVREGLLSLPAVSLVTDLPNFFDSETGILFNPNGRGSQWERPCSMEFLSPPGTNRPNGSQEFQIDCGARTRGGFSRDPSNPKHGFHLYFRGRYGAPKLEYPLFGESGAQTFDQIDLRTAQNYSWSFGGDLNNSFLREESSRRAQLEMGQPASHVRYFHLFINGHYWGLFNFDERKEASFGATYFGGSKEEYDVIKCEQSEGYVTGITDGQIDAWRDLWEKGRAHAATPSNAAYFSLMGLQADGTTPSTDPVLLDVDNLIDYLLLTFWTGNEDGCTSAFLGNGTANNWFGLRNRNSTAGFRFFAHDFEHSLGLPSGSAGVDRTGPFESENRALFERSNPYFLHLDLLPNPEYRIRWADRIQKHLFGNGALSTAAWTRRIQTLAAEIDSAITAESARWGGAKTETPLNRRHWLDSKNWILNTFIPARHDIVLAQLRKPELGLFPQTDAPQLSPSGGRVAPGTPLTVLSTSTVYRMPDGSDPRAIGGGIRPGAIASPPSTGSTQTPVSFGSQWRYLDTGVDQGSAWRTAGFDDSAWALGNGELGYGDGDETTAIQGGPADARHATAYFRRTFSLTGVSGIVSATLSLKYDDEAWVYLNGQLVHKTAVGLPDNPRFDAYTGTGNENTAATFTLDPALFLEGSNLLAV